jgi:hypothetical protein
MRLLAVLLATLLLPVSAAGAAPPIAIFNLTDTPEVKPHRYFLAADAGPYIAGIKWSGWGTQTATGRGTFIADCASCGPKERVPATLVVRKVRDCPRYGVRVYRIGVLTVHHAGGRIGREKFPTSPPKC